MNNFERESLIEDLAAANEAVLKKHGVKNAKWDATYFLDGDEEVMASNVSGPIGSRSKPEE